MDDSLVATDARMNRIANAEAEEIFKECTFRPNIKADASALEKVAVDEMLLEKISTQVCSLALSEERLAHNCVVDLVAQATKLLTARQSDLVPHSTNEGDLCNDTEMRAATSAAVKKLQALLDKAAAVTASLNLSAEGMLDLSTVERLRELKLITAEEELLQFVLSANEVQDEAQRMTLIVRTANEEPVAATSPEVTSAEQSWVSLPALRDLSGRIKELANNTMVRRFQTGRKHHDALQQTLSALLDMQANAEKLWSIVRDCTRGNAVCGETLRDAIRKAGATGVRDEAISNAADQWLQEAVDVEEERTASLAGIVDATEETVQNMLACAPAGATTTLTAEAASHIREVTILGKQLLPEVGKHGAINLDTSHGLGDTHSINSSDLNLANDRPHYSEKPVRLYQTLQDHLHAAVKMQQPSVEVLQQSQQPESSFAVLMHPPSESRNAQVVNQDTSGPVIGTKGPPSADDIATWVREWTARNPDLDAPTWVDLCEGTAAAPVVMFRRQLFLHGVTLDQLTAHGGLTDVGKLETLLQFYSVSALSKAMRVTSKVIEDQNQSGHQQKHQERQHAHAFATPPPPFLAGSWADHSRHGLSTFDATGPPAGTGQIILQAAAPPALSMTTGTSCPTNLGPNVAARLLDNLQLSTNGGATLKQSTLVGAGSRVLIIPTLSVRQHLVDALTAYLDRGEAVRGDIRCQELSEYLRASVALGLSQQQAYPMYFFFVEASSGMGKSQLAFSLSLPVVYVPLSDRQSIYQCFSAVSGELQRALYKDGRDVDLDSEGFRSMVLFADRTVRYETVGLLVALCRAVKGKSNSESLRLLSGNGGAVEISYAPMTLSEAEAAIQAEALFPLFYIDEIPSNSKAEAGSFKRCILLRNLVRCMQGICVLSGTEAAAMNVVDFVGGGSRGKADIDYMRVVVDLPPTYWAAFAADARYSTLIESLDKDTVQLLQQTRPLFVEYALDALLQERAVSDSTGPCEGGALVPADAPTTPDGPLQQQVTSGITCTGETSALGPSLPAATRLSARVLAAVKKRILDEKRLFCSPHGLFAQLALVHSRFVEETSLDPESTYPNAKSGKTDPTRDALYCIRHHFGKLRLYRDTTREDASSSVVKLVLGAGGGVLVPTKQGSRLFKPSGMFAAPHEDPFLYLACLRDGVYYKADEAIQERVSTTFALHMFYKIRRDQGFPLFLNTNQKTCSGKVLEMEVGSAAVVASHSYGSDGSNGAESLTGCPLSFFTRSLIAELNPHQRYVPEHDFNLSSLPAVYDTIRVPLLSAVNTSWTSGGDATCLKSLQKDSMILVNYVWSANGDCNDGRFLVRVVTGANASVCSASNEAKCFERNTPTAEVSKTVKNTVRGHHRITFMVTTNLAATKSDNDTFHNAEEVKQCHVVKIVGDKKTIEDGVARKLICETVREDPAIAQGYLPDHTVVVISLETIYPARYAMMEPFYHST